MRKILGGASALALVMALSVPSLAADLTVDGGGAITDANAISVNLQSQDTDQSIDNEENVDGTYNGDMNFGNHTFDDQKINSNNFNSGQNAAQQNGVGLSIDLVDEYGSAAVSANVLHQVSTQSMTSWDENVDDGATYNGDMNFGTDTFRNQKINANNFNSGMNAAQQGGVAVSVNLPKFTPIL